MKLHLKNKYEVSVLQMLKEANDRQGIPDFILIDQHEAWDVLREINRHRNEEQNLAKTRALLSDIRVESHPHSVTKGDFENLFYIKLSSERETSYFRATDPRVQVYGPGDIDKELATDLIHDWIDKKFVVYYGNTPIYVDPVFTSKNDESKEKEKIHDWSGKEFN